MADSLTLDYPFADAAAFGQPQEVAPGIFWLRMPLDLTGLDHINLWLLDDTDGWTIVDTGMDSERIRAIWTDVFKHHLGGRPVVRVICTHFHPDHMGLAGWLCDHWRAPLWATRQEWLFGRMLYLDAEDAAPDWYIDHYRRVGFSDEALDKLRERGFNNYRSIVSPVPAQVHGIRDRDVIDIGGRGWRVITGFGHSPEHACLYCEELGVIISGDQILPRITPHIGVYPSEAEGNPLQDYIDSLDRFPDIGDDVLDLPAHGLPFRGVQRRLEYLRRHHAHRLTVLEETCIEPTRVLSMLKVMFGRRLKPFEAFLGVGEAIAHLNCLRADGRIVREEDDDGVWVYRAKRARADAA